MNRMKQLSIIGIAAALILLYAGCTQSLIGIGDEESGNLAVTFNVPRYGVLGVEREAGPSVIDPATDTVELLLDGGIFSSVLFGDLTSTAAGDVYSEFSYVASVPARTYQTVRIRLLDASGEVLASGEAAESGPYAVTVGGTLPLTVYCLPESYQTIPADTDVTVSTAPGKMAYLAHEIAADSTFTVTVTGTDVVGYVFDMNGEYLGATTSTTYSGGGTGTPGGLYYIGVYNQGAVDVDATVRIETSAAAGLTYPVINEVSLGNPDAFEIYNPHATALDLSGYTVVRKRKYDDTVWSWVDETTYHIVSDALVPAHSYVAFMNDFWSGDFDHERKVWLDKEILTAGWDGWTNTDSRGTYGYWSVNKRSVPRSRLDLDDPYGANYGRSIHLFGMSVYDGERPTVRPGETPGITAYSHNNGAGEDYTTYGGWFAVTGGSVQSLDPTMSTPVTHVYYYYDDIAEKDRVNMAATAADGSVIEMGFYTTGLAVQSYTTELTDGTLNFSIGSSLDGSYWLSISSGTLTITQFDMERLAGTFDLTMTNGDTLTGEFSVEALYSSPIYRVNIYDESTGQHHYINNGQTVAWKDANTLSFAVSGGGATDSDLEIFTRDVTDFANPGAVTRLTDNSVDDWGAVFSPDGMYVAYLQTDAVDGDAEIVVANADGTSPVVVTATTETERDLSWSPDSTHLAFVRDTSPDVGDVWIVNVSTPASPAETQVTSMQRAYHDTHWIDTDTVAYTMYDPDNYRSLVQYHSLIDGTEYTIGDYYDDGDVIMLGASSATYVPGNLNIMPLFRFDEWSGSVYAYHANFYLDFYESQNVVSLELRDPSGQTVDCVLINGTSISLPYGSWYTAGGELVPEGETLSRIYDASTVPIDTNTAGDWVTSYGTLGLANDYTGTENLNGSVY